MNLLIEFYKNLDMINLIVFWGIVIVLILLLIFAIILNNKNKKLKEMLRERSVYEEKAYDEIPVKEDDNETKLVEEKESSIEISKETPTVEEEIQEEKKESNFVAEEYVMEYNQNLFSLPNIKKAEPYEENKEINKSTVEKSGPYQRNILKEVSSRQTSPIGIVKHEKNESTEQKNAQELYDNFHSNEIQEKVETAETNNKAYIDEVSQKLAKAAKKDEVDRTEYEIRQEADAIISYDELMEKKDKIKAIDEEEAVISIDELMQKSQEQEKLYDLTEKEENDKFIKELKNFRDDL